MLLYMVRKPRGCLTDAGRALMLPLDAPLQYDRAHECQMAAGGLDAGAKWGLLLFDRAHIASMPGVDDMPLASPTLCCSTFVWLWIVD